MPAIYRACEKQSGRLARACRREEANAIRGDTLLSAAHHRSGQALGGELLRGPCRRAGFARWPSRGARTFRRRDRCRASTGGNVRRSVARIVVGWRSRFGLQDFGHHGRETLPIRSIFSELFPTATGNRIKLGFAVVVRST